MKIVLKIILTVIFILLSLILAISGTFKFQLLKISFWENTFEAEGTYSALSRAVINNLENSVTSKGGNISDVAVFTDLATSANLKDLINRNIENLFSFVDGKAGQMNIYIPIGRIPKSLLPVGLNGSSSQISLQDFLKETGFVSVSAAQIQEIQMLPKIANALFFASIFLLLMISLAEYALTSGGRRLWFNGAGLILSGGVIFSGAKIFEILKTGLILDLIKRTDLAGVIAGVMAPPVMTEISKVWTIEGIAAILLGVILFFIKKPYNQIRREQ